MADHFPVTSINSGEVKLVLWDQTSPDVVLYVLMQHWHFTHKYCYKECYNLEHVSSQESDWSCICMLGVPSQESDRSCICMLGVSSQESDWSCICMLGVPSQESD
jgi:ferredoxin-thioredoxin reductase catalytic subunit